MQTDERDLLEVLRFELNFLEKGGYGRSPREAWRPQFIFEDSPTCMNYDSKENPEPCSHCVLMQLVPPGFRSAKTPCRHIPLNEAGESLDSLYRYDDQPEIEESVGNWLRRPSRRWKNHARRRSLIPLGTSPRPIALPCQALRCFRSFTPSARTPRVPQPFIGSAAANSSASAPMKLTSCQSFPHTMLRVTCTACGIFGCANAAATSLRWCTTRSTESCFSYCGRSCRSRKPRSNCRRHLPSKTERRRSALHFYDHDASFAPAFCELPADSVRTSKSAGAAVQLMALANFSG